MKKFKLFVATVVCITFLLISWAQEVNDTSTEEIGKTTLKVGVIAGYSGEWASL